jgi:hypothetical protein
METEIQLRLKEYDYTNSRNNFSKSGKQEESLLEMAKKGVDNFLKKSKDKEEKQKKKRGDMNVLLSLLDKNDFRETARKLGCSYENIRLRARKLGIKRLRKGSQEMYCQRCGVKILSKFPKQYCSNWCYLNKKTRTDGKKKCSLCEKYKDLEQFSRLTICRTCDTKRMNKYYADNPERVRASTKKYQNKNKEKVRAWSMICLEVKQGRIKKKSCEICGDRKVHAHHDDYSKPLEVRWLCPLHHKRRHRELKIDNLQKKNMV